MRKSFQKPSPASNASTVGAKCQKCLQEGHWTADCTNERVYKPRPSRTALLFNPKLKLPEESIVKDDFVDEKRNKALEEAYENSKAGEADFAEKLISEVKQAHRVEEYEEGQIRAYKSHRDHRNDRSYEERREIETRSYSPSRSRSPRGRDRHRRDFHRSPSRSHSRPSSPRSFRKEKESDKVEVEKAQKKYSNYASDSDFSSDSE